MIRMFCDRCGIVIYGTKPFGKVSFTVNMSWVNGDETVTQKEFERHFCNNCFQEETDRMLHAVSLNGIKERKKIGRY